MSAVRVLFAGITILGAMATVFFVALYFSGIAGAATNIALILAVFFGICSVAAAIGWKRSPRRPDPAGGTQR